MAIDILPKEDLDMSAVGPNGGGRAVTGPGTRCRVIICQSTNLERNGQECGRLNCKIRAHIAKRRTIPNLKEKISTLQKKLADGAVLVEEAERKLAEEAERMRVLEEELKLAEEAERKLAEEAERKLAEEAERKLAEEAERMRAEEAERMRAEEAEWMRVLEAERMRAEEAERMRAEEAERMRAEEAERMRVLEAERMRVLEAERMRVLEAERKRAEEAEQKRLEEDDVYIQRRAHRPYRPYLPAPPRITGRKRQACYDTVRIPSQRMARDKFTFTLPVITLGPVDTRRLEENVFPFSCKYTDDWTRFPSALLGRRDSREGLLCYIKKDSVNGVIKLLKFLYLQERFMWETGVENIHILNDYTVHISDRMCITFTRRTYQDQTHQFYRPRASTPYDNVRHR